MPFYINNVTMSDPGDAPFIPDLLKGLFLNFNAAIDAPGDGNRVSSIIMRHGNSAVSADYTFDRLRGTGTQKPLSLVVGVESFINFDGNSTLSNNSAGSTLIEGAFTEAFRVRINDWASLTGNSGIRRGIPNYTAGYRSGGSVGVLSAGGGATSSVWTNFPTGIQEQEWGTVIVTYDDTNGDTVLAGSGDVAVINIAAGARIKGLGFGANNETTGLAGKFDMSHYALWNRALTADEMLITREIFNARGDIQDV
ncbi:TPA: hypothetical protein I8Y43_004544 [Raoultella ornithinolytica]|jgi:hypothetical protein|nr:hypothetical protein [Raoultella ornithinolytica]